MAHELEAVFNPQSVAIVGASRREGSIGWQVTKNMIVGGFEGPIYPINPGAADILGLKCYPSIGDVPGPVDAAVYCVPADKVLDVARQCAKKGVKGHIVITSGFAEVGNKKDEEELLKIARESGGRVIGPNIVGIMSNPGKANASFAPILPYNGQTALVSQSGALIIALDTVTFARRFGVTSMISLGNMADVDFADCIDYYAQDPHTKCIALYVEGVKAGYRFIQAGRKAGKPIVAVKAGVSAHGAAARPGQPLKTAPAEVQAEFRKFMPDYGSPRNPVDITGGSGVDGYRGALAAALKMDWVEGIGVFYCETAVTKPVEVAQAVIDVVRESGVTTKPVIACFVGGEKSVEAGQKLLESNIPYYDCPNKTMAAFAALRQAAQFEAQACLDSFDPYTDVDMAKAKAIIAEARKSGRRALTEPEAKSLFAAYGLPVTKSSLAKTEDEAVAYAQEIGFPIVLKIVSPDILHKSDAGGVRVNLKDAESVRTAFRTIMANAKKYKADADIHGILVCEMAPLGSEVICGSVNDPTFGPTIMFGLGGIFVEVLKDVTFRVAPVSKECAMTMFPEIRCYPILQGVRGEKAKDQEALADVLARLSQLVSDFDDEIAETDANPILLYEEGKGCRVVDARIILKKK